MSDNFDLVERYPWLPSFKKYFSDRASKNPSKFVSEVFSEEFGFDLKQRILKLFEAAFQNLEEVSDYKTDKLNGYVYLLLKIFLYALDNRMITNRIANLYSKITYNELIKKKRDILRMAEMLHDVGKVTVSDLILKKPGRFNDKEFEIMKTHTFKGARLFKDRQSEFDEIAKIVAR